MLDMTLVHEIILALIIGGLTGRLTDFGAVQLLFRPYTPKRLGPLTLHGVLPARQEALARQVANSIADRLLSEETLVTFISSPEMALKIRENVHLEVDRIVDRDLPSVALLLGELLDDPHRLDEEIRVLSSWAGENLASLAGNEDIRARSASVVARMLLERKHMRMDEILAPGVLDALYRFLSGRLQSLVEDPAKVADSLDQWLLDLGPPGNLLSESAQGTVRREAREKIPDWLKAVEDTLRRTDTQEWLDRYVLDGVESFIEDLPRQGFLGELVGWFIRTTYQENKLSYRRKLLEILPLQVANFRESLKSPENMLLFNRKMDQAFDEILNTSAGKRYESIPQELRRDLRGLLKQLLSSEETISSLKQIMDHMVERFRSAPLEEFLPTEWRSLEPENLDAASRSGPIREAIDFFYDLLLEAGLQQQLQTMLTQGASFMLSQPIGRLRDRLGEERLAKIHGTVESQLISFAEREAPRLARLIDIRTLVEAKIRGADARGIEHMVKSLARKELNSIFTKGLYGGIVISLVLTTVLLSLEHLVELIRPGFGLMAIIGTGACLLVIAARHLRIPES